MKRLRMSKMSGVASSSVIKFRRSNRRMRTYLLRFEEYPLPPHSASNGSREVGNSKSSATIVAATKTLTEIKREGVDADPQLVGFCALPK